MKIRSRVPKTFRERRERRGCPHCAGKLAEALEGLRSGTLGVDDLLLVRHVLDAEPPYGTTVVLKLEDGSRLDACPRCTEIWLDDRMEPATVGQLDSRFRRSLRFRIADHPKERGRVILRGRS